MWVGYRTRSITFPILMNFSNPCLNHYPPTPLSGGVPEQGKIMKVVLHSRFQAARKFVFTSGTKIQTGSIN
jgi:hypothetical protein